MDLLLIEHRIIRSSCALALKQIYITNYHLSYTIHNTDRKTSLTIVEVVGCWLCLPQYRKHNYNQIAALPVKCPSGFVFSDVSIYICVLYVVPIYPGTQVFCVGNPRRLYASFSLIILQGLIGRSQG